MLAFKNLQMRPGSLFFNAKRMMADFAVHSTSRLSFSPSDFVSTARLGMMSQLCAMLTGLALDTDSAFVGDRRQVWHCVRDSQEHLQVRAIPWCSHLGAREALSVPGQLTVRDKDAGQSALRPRLSQHGGSPRDGCEVSFSL